MSIMKEPYFGLRGGWLTFWVTVACATDMTLFGYDQGVFSGVIVTKDFLDLMHLHGDDKMQSTVTAIYDIGCFLGAVSSIWIGEHLGRKRSILVGTLVMSVGALLQTVAFNVPMLFVGRIVAGIGNGINTSTAPVWQGETSKASWRGKLVIIEMVMNVAGFSLSNWINYGMSYAPGSVAWRFPLALQFIFIFILFLTVPWLPESPRWLISKGRLEEASVILADLEDLPVEDPFVITQWQDIQWGVNYERENTIPWTQLLRGRVSANGGTGTIRRLVLGMGSQCMQQLSGINVTSYYLPLVLMNSVGLEEKLARLLAACNSVSYLLFSMIGIPNVENWGRRKLLMYCAAGQAVCYIAITICIRYNEDAAIGAEASAKWAKASVAFFFGYYAFFGVGWQGVPWLYPTEINSLSMRTKGASLATATNWIVNFMVVEITPIGIAAQGWKFYILWTVFNASFVPIVYLFYPETADRSLEDVDRFFANNHEVLIFRNAEATSSKRPLKYIDNEQSQVLKNGAVIPADIRKSLERRADGSPKDEESGTGSVAHIEK